MMAGLGETIAALKRGRQSTGVRPQTSSRSARLTPVADFGANPGQLTMRLYTPKDLAARRPLVVVLHGCLQTAEAYADGAGWLTLADRYGFAVVCPQQQSSNNPNLCFNWFEPTDTGRGQGEAGSIRAMIDTAVGSLESDRAQIYVTGLSAGGAMASALLAAYPEVFAGGGIIAGLPYGVARGMPQAFAAMLQDSGATGRDLGDHVRAASANKGQWPRVSVWHGQADTTVKPSNADAVIAQWANVHGLDPETPNVRRQANGDTHDVWSLNGEPLLERRVIAGLGHGTPLAASGPKGVGRPGPFMLEAGVSSSLELLNFWGIGEATQSAAEPAGRQAKPCPRGEAPAKASLPTIAVTRLRENPPSANARRQDSEIPTSNVGAIINKALRAAGLL